MRDFNEFVDMSNEIYLDMELNNLATEADTLLATIYHCIDNYTKDICMDKLTESLILRYAFIDLSNKAMLANNYTVDDYAQVYVVELDCIASKLRNKYNELNY